MPDSDDESAFDSSSESEPELPQQHIDVHPKSAKEAGPVNDSTVWDIPLSSQTFNEVNEEVEERNADRNLIQPPLQASSTQPRTTYETHNSHEPHEPLDPYHLESSPLSSPPIAPSNDLEDTAQPAEVGNVVSDHLNTPKAAGVVSPEQFVTAVFEAKDVSDESEDEFEQRTLQFGRSLRPRKPIQEHPYLLESAQYSNALKSRGLRPLRLQAEEAARRRQEDDSQEQEYEDESQSTAIEFAREEAEESQDIPPADLLNDIDDELPPAGSLSETHEQREIPQNTWLNSSQIDEDEFPDLADVDKWKLDGKKSSTTTVSAKRQGSPKLSKKNKLQSLHKSTRSAEKGSLPVTSHSIFDIPLSPPQTSSNPLALTPDSAAGRSRPIPLSTPKPSSTISRLIDSPARANQRPCTIDLTIMDDEDEPNDQKETESSDNSESDSEVVQATMRRRIRGVLPASWLRLDQQTTHQKNKRAPPQRSPDHSPERTQRKGVAQRRKALSGSSTNIIPSLDDSDDNMTLGVNDFDDPYSNTSNTSNIIPVFEDDVGSVVEDDSIDYMLSRGKRTNAVTDGTDRPRKRRKNNQPIPKGQHRQPRITKHLDGAKNTTARSVANKCRGKNASHTEHRTKEPGRVSATFTPPPYLSILDVMESNAPSFIRVAARTARHRLDKGRSSPSRKQIALGKRSDNVDAVGTLRDWKMGRIQPKVSHNTTNPLLPTSSKPLQPLSQNQPIRPPKSGSRLRPHRTVPSSRFSQPLVAIKQARLDNFVTTEAAVSSKPTQPQPTNPLPRPRQINRTGSSNAASRPAQLETTGERAGRYAFHAQKRALDALYRNSRRTLPTSTSVGLERLVGGSESVADSDIHDEDPPPSNSPEKLEPVPLRKRLKPRKHFQPRRVDTAEPQYAHANDPLPPEVSPVSPFVEVTRPSEPTGKLLGLGPFGTHYTQHFEIFPLDLGVFFHESTLLGSGRLMKALEEKPRDSLHRPRGHGTFILDEKTLRWGRWDAQTSSEVGIAFDWIVDYLHSAPSDSSNSVSPVQAVEFILDYLQCHVSFSGDESEKHFTGRALEMLQSFANRLEALPRRAQSEAQLFIDILSRTLLITLQVLRICHDLGQLSELFHLEEVLSRIAKRAVHELLATDLVDIRNIFCDLQQTRFRERGIRNEHHSMVCWTILIRVLEEAHIPKSGFWDLVSSAMLNTDLSAINDAHSFERIWRNLFTLLPLGEFDNTGVIIPGTRHFSPLEGWALPQKLLKRIFQLYESNSRQAPSFNDYCRGIVSRCHYLVEQWGWRKCNSIIGTIFDFFAARGLSHLRNEEVYKSPEFLENLAESPSLVILPEDKCFHIFLKLLALSIKRLNNYGLTKDTRNLVARVLPNHDRQYDKEKDIYESDLAALRNHHDLLCTLFWAAPPSLRPSVQTIEKLVLPSSSHKEACLISLRAWSQLSRFVISHEDNDKYKAFADWQRNIFQQVMEQYLSAETDIQTQLLNMSKNASKDISREMMKTVIKLNRKSAMDVLYFSMRGFLGVMQNAPTLSAASFALNYYQLDQVFKRFPFSSIDFDWSSLRAALDILDYYITQIEKFLRQDFIEADYSWHGEDAILLLERKMAAPFFEMLRTITTTDFRDSELGPTSDRMICIEQAILLGARLAARLIHAQLMTVSQVFVAVGFGMSRKPSTAVGLPSRQYHTLFLATLVEQGICSFKDLGCTTLDFILTEIVKPYHFLAYENRLALAIKRHGSPYLKDAAIKVGNSPDYNSNRVLFRHVVAMMRKTLLSMDSKRRRELQADFSKTVKGTMDQMKLDLKWAEKTVTREAHKDYIEFVQSIVSMIKSHDICPVDTYFYRISPEYSPSRQDPRLQLAGILSWALRLEEGETNAASNLFYLLLPNFKLAVEKSKLQEEKVIIMEGMRNRHFLAFILGRMFPAIITTLSGGVNTFWALLNLYMEAFEDMLTTPCIHGQIGKRDGSNLVVLLDYAISAIARVWGCSQHPNPPHMPLYTLTQLIHLLNLLLPMFTAYLVNNAPSQSTVARDIAKRIDYLTNHAITANKHIRNSLNTGNSLFPLQCAAPREQLGVESNDEVEKFAQVLAADLDFTLLPTQSKWDVGRLASEYKQLSLSLCASWGPSASNSRLDLDLLPIDRFLF